MPDKLAELRRQNGLSQIELAEAMNVSRQAVSQWESGATIPSIDSLMALSKFYGVTLDEVMCNHAPEKPAEAGAAEAEKEGSGEKSHVRKALIVLLAAAAAAVVFTAGLMLGAGNAPEAPAATPEIFVEDLNDYLEDYEFVVQPIG